MGFSFRGVGQTLVLHDGGGVASVAYYIDATNGNDSNTGLTPELAWQTINKVNNSTFDPGNQILFKRGETWREQLNVPSSGVAGNPIFIGTYGSGAKPRVLGSDVPAEWTLENYVPTPVIELAQGPLNIIEADASVTRAWTSTPTEGSLLIACGSGNSAIANASISGWTLAISALCTGAGTSVGIWYKVAGAGEGNVTLNWTGSTDTGLQIMEWTGIGTPALDQIAYTDTTGATVTSRSSGTTPTTTADNELCVATVKMGSTVSGLTWSNSFTNRNTTSPSFFSATNVVSAAGTQETTASWTTARLAGGCIATFKSGAATVPLYYASQSADPGYIWIVDTGGTVHSGNKVASKDLLLAEYDWWFDDPNNRLYVYSPTDPATRYDSVEVSSTTRTRGIMWTATSLSYVSVDNIEMAFITGNGIVGRDHWRVTNCYVHHLGNEAGNHSYGIEIQTGDGAYVGYNTVHDTLQSGIFLVGSYDPFTCTNVTVEHNTVYDCYKNLIWADTESVQLECSGHIIRYNSLYHTAGYTPSASEGMAVYVSGIAGVAADSIQVYYNLVKVKKAGIYLDQYTTSVGIYNNSVLTTGGIGIFVSATGTSGHKIKNNLVADSGIASLKIDEINAITESNYNCWFTSSGTVYANIETVSYGSGDFAAYKVATGFDANGLWQDPLIVSAADFHLQAGSPCIGAGVNVGLTQDYDGVAIGSPPDVGAYEYV